MSGARRGAHAARRQARSYINAVVCGFLGACAQQRVAPRAQRLTAHACCPPAEFEADGSPDLSTVKPMVDGGTEGFKARGRPVRAWRHVLARLR
jgi:ubiquitin-activating enzyme E1 C